MAVHLEWVGMACFRLWQDGGPVIAMDPYTPSAIGLVDDGKRISADTVIVSSLTDVAHANVGLIEGEPQVINALDVARGKKSAQIYGAPLAGGRSSGGRRPSRRRRRQRLVRLQRRRALVPAHG